eukprot:2457904-Pleurochrysis_carterae.AAC.1
MNDLVDAHWTSQYVAGGWVEAEQTFHWASVSKAVWQGGYLMHCDKKKLSQAEGECELPYLLCTALFRERLGPVF